MSKKQNQPDNTDPQDQVRDVDDIVDAPAEDLDEAQGVAGSDALSEQDLAAQAVQAEMEDLKNRLLRVTADYQNYVKRSHQNTQSAIDQQVMKMARDLVVVLDHFDRALDVDPQKTSAADLLKGVQSIRDELMRALGKHGIERIVAERGQTFDPNRHEALMRVAEKDLNTNDIAAQFQPGYALNDKVIRPAGVSVAE